MMRVCTDFAGFGRGFSYLVVEFGLHIKKKNSLGDAAHHTASTVKTMAILTCTKAFYSICYICNGKLQILVANAKILTCKCMCSEDTLSYSVN